MAYLGAKTTTATTAKPAKNKINNYIKILLKKHFEKIIEAKRLLAIIFSIYDMIERGTSKSFVARIYSIAIVMINMLVQSLVINHLCVFSF